MTAVLHIESLHVVRGGRMTLSLSGISLNAGEVLGIMGPSGSGKSTLARALIGMADADETLGGEVTIAGHHLSSGEIRRGRDIGLVFQDPLRSFNPLISVGQHVAEAVRWHFKLSRAAAWGEAQKAFERVGLPGDMAFLKRYPHQLSGGQRQRVAIAGVMVLKPKLLIADEPTSALDVLTQDHISQLLRRLARDDGIGLVFISHDLGLLARVADQMVVLSQGEIVESGATAKIISDPQHQVTKALLAAARDAPVPEPMMSTGDDILALHNVTRRYGARAAVTDISFALKRGQALGIVGESGSGKSTLLRAVLALEAVQGGRVYVAGQEFSIKSKNIKLLRRKIQAVFQDPSGSFDPQWTIARIVAEPLFLLDQKLGEAEIASRVAAALEVVGLPADLAKRRPHQFSGGQKQKIAIARALILQPDILVLDEAVSALDAVSKRQILDLLVDLKARLGLSLVFVSHDLAAVRGVADHIMILKRAEMVEFGPTKAIFSAPQNPYTQALLAAVPTLP